MAVLQEPIKEPLEIKNFIDGEWVDSEGEYKDIINPATGQVIGRVGNRGIRDNIGYGVNFAQLQIDAVQSDLGFQSPAGGLF